MKSSSGIDNEEIGALIQPDRVHKRVYVDEAIFELEMERIWGRAWIFIGHESQVSKAGDYYTTAIGKQKLILTRDDENVLHVLFNRCPHKGAQLVGDTCGNSPQIRCPYHGYVFGNDGSISHIPQKDGYANDEFGLNSPNSNIRKVPRMQMYRGFVFASLSPSGPDLLDWLGVAVTSFDNAVERSPTGEIEIIGGRLQYLHDANWKVLLENVTDNMHPAVTHQSAWQPAKQLGQSFDEGTKPLEISMLEPFGSSYDFFDSIAMTVCSLGHSYAGGSASIHSTDVEKEYLLKMEDAYGKEKTRDILSMNRQNTVIYPSIAFKSALQTIRIYRPLAVNKTIQETWTYKLKGAPDRLLENSVAYNQLIFSPSSIAGHDDYEAYHRIQHGLQTQASDWVSQHRYLGDDVENNDQSRTGKGTSDIVFRHEFEAWKHYMTMDDPAESPSA